LTANMPAAASAVALLAEAPGLGVGVHLNASQGPPLSRDGQALAGEDGMMNRTATGVILACVRRPSLIDAIEAEFDAQVRWALDHGIRPTHLDSHRHTHAFTPIFSRVAQLARRYDIPFVRRHREVLPDGPLGPWPPAPKKQRRIARLLNVFGRINAMFQPGLLCTHGTWGVRHTGLIDREFLFRAAAAVGPGVTEIMTHPGLADDVDASTTRLLQCRLDELSALCDPNVRAEFDKNQVRRIHYGNLPDIRE
jgi:predicted glycoside hydrolase/deacetylase ChbG (UPF0249 family)